MSGYFFRSLVTFSLLIAASIARAEDKSASGGVILVHTNDVLGEIEPCGCRSNPLGGMARKAQLVKSLGPASSLLQLDAGDLLFPSNTLPEMLRAQSLLQARFLLRSMDMLGHDAVVPGEKEFALGLKAFEELKRGAKLRFLAANLSRKKGGAFLAADAIFTKQAQPGAGDAGTTAAKPLKIGVFGIVGRSLDWPRELRATDPIAAARREVAKLRKSCDLIIALTHEGLEEDRKLAASVKGIDVIVGGHTQSFLQKPAKAGTTWILQSSFRNQYVGEFPLARVSKLQDGDYRLVPLDASLDSPPDAPSAMDDLVKEFKLRIAELNSREEARSVGAVDARAADSALKSDEKFHTFARCAECHYKQFDFWRKTPHARAFHALVDKAQDKNKECLTCHTVGLGDPQGFAAVDDLAEMSPTNLAHGELDSYLTAMHDADSLDSKVKLGDAVMPLRDSLGKISRIWTPVQCENCHRAGGAHPFFGSYTKSVEKDACLRCHTSERAPEWYTPAGQPDWDKIQAKRASITCPAGN